MTLQDDPEKFKQRDESYDDYDLDGEAEEVANTSSVLTEEIRRWRRIVSSRITSGNSSSADCTTLLEFATRSLLETLAIDKTVHPSLADASRQVVWDALYEIASSMDIAAAAAQDVFERVTKGNGQVKGSDVGIPTKTALLLPASPFVLRDPAAIAPRPHLLKHLIRGFTSTTIGRPGDGKSGVVLAEALAMSSGLPILGDQPEKPLRVWYIGEDPFDEIERRIVAACRYHNISKEQIAGRLFVNSTLDLPPIKIAEQKGRRVILNKHVIDALAAEIKRLKIDVLILDPLIKFHGVAEGDNSSMEIVLRALGELASDFDIAIDLPHHTRKQMPGVSGPVTADDGRGASAIIGAVRMARVLNRMSSVDADKAGIAEGDRWRYFRLDTAKANMSPPESARWFQHASQILPCGESVGVVECWKFPDAFAGVTGADVTQIRALARTGAFRANVRSPDWFGHAVATHLNLDISQPKERARVRAMLKTWLRNKVLDIEVRGDQQRRQRQYIVPGPWKDTEDDGTDDV